MYYYYVCATNTMSHGSPGTRPLLYRISVLCAWEARRLIRLLSLILFSSQPPTHPPNHPPATYGVSDPLVIVVYNNPLRYFVNSIPFP